MAQSKPLDFMRLGAKRRKSQSEFIELYNKSVRTKHGYRNTKIHGYKNSHTEARI